MGGDGFFPGIQVEAAVGPAEKLALFLFTECQKFRLTAVGTLKPGEAKSEVATAIEVLHDSDGIRA